MDFFVKIVDSIISIETKSHLHRISMWEYLTFNQHRSTTIGPFVKDSFVQHTTVTHPTEK